MKTALNIILFLNTIYVFVCSEDQNPATFAFPVFIYGFFGFFRDCHKDFTKYLNTPISHEKNT